MKLIKLVNAEMLEEFTNNSMFTFEGIDIVSEQGQKSLMEFEEKARSAGYKNGEMIGYWFKGKFMNEAYGYTGENAYRDDITFLVIPDFRNPGFKVAVGARWFDDIVASNSIKQHAVDENCEPDFN